MIETVEIKNFQPHKHTILEFSPGVNVIKGTSHSGKSSIWRLIYWILKNRPLGEGFRSHFTNEDTEGHIEFDNGVVSRIKGSKNVYQVNAGEDLEAIKSDIPTEVTNVTNISDVNLQGQDDPYFLLFDSPGNVARELNKVVGLDIIDKSLKKANKIILDASSHKKITKKEIKSTKEKIENLKWLDSAEVLINRIDDHLQEVSKISQRRDKLSSLIVSCTELDKDIEYINKWLEITVPHQNLVSKVDKWRRNEDERISLSKRINEIGNLNIEILILKKWLLIKTDSERILSNAKEYKKVNKKLRQLKSLYDSIKQLEINVNSANKKATILGIQYDKKLKSAGICPLCKRPW